MINRKMGVAAVLSAFTLLLLPVNVFAAETASNYKELAKIVNEHGVRRDEEEFIVEYTGPESDVTKLMEDEYSYFFFADVPICDDPNTPEDADYVLGNMKLELGDYLEAAGNTLYFNLKYYEKPEQTEYVREQVPAILKKLKVEGMSNYEKVRTIHDYVCNQISYFDDNTDVVSTVYGALKNGKGICNSYAVCMYRFLVEAGIPCKYVRGTAGTGRDADAHAWNIVALGDRWYLLDATWDDGDDVLCYDYFLKGTSDFDAADPSQPHELEKAFTDGEYAEKFPIAKTGFKEGMEDENKVVKIGGDYEPDPEPKPGEYVLSDIVSGTYPDSATFSVRRKKTGDLQIFIRKDMDTLIKSVDYEITKGIKCVRNVELSELYYDEESGEYFCDLSFKGKKKGKVDIDIILELTNGQKLVQTFRGKIK